MTPPAAKSSPKRDKMIRLRLIVFCLPIMLGIAWCARYAIWVKVVNESLDSIAQGKLPEAREQAHQAITMMSFLPDPNSFALSLRLLSSIHACRRQFKEAELYNRRLLEFDKKIWGDYSPEYAGDLSDLALMKRKQRQFDDSEQLYRDVINIYASCLDRDVEKARMQALLAWVLIQKSKYKEALKLIKESDLVLIANFSETSFERLVGLVERAYVYKLTSNKENLPDAISTAYKLISTPEELEKSSAQTVVVINLLAQMLAEQNENDKALKAFQIAENNCKTSAFGGTYNTYMADVLEPYARLLEKMGKAKEAEVLRRRAKQIREIPSSANG